MIERTVIISDIHGCIHEFYEMLKLVDAKSPNVRVILLGDLLDRGPDSAGCVRKARELGIESVKGNHENKFLKWYRSVGSRNDVYDKNKFYDDLSDADINYIMRMPYYLKIDNTIIAHAGVRPYIRLEKQSNDLMHIRYLNSKNEFVSLHKVNKIGKEAADAHYWTEDWKGPESIIYGHHVHSYKDPLIEEVAPGVMCYGLDTGCVFGGKLTALILETKEVIQVQSKEVYYKSDLK